MRESLQFGGRGMPSACARLRQPHYVLFSFCHVQCFAYLDICIFMYLVHDAQKAAFAYFQFASDYNARYFRFTYLQRRRRQRATPTTHETKIGKLVKGIRCTKMKVCAKACGNTSANKVISCAPLLREKILLRSANT